MVKLFSVLWEYYRMECIRFNSLDINFVSLKFNVYHDLY